TARAHMLGREAYRGDRGTQRGREHDPRPRRNAPWRCQELEWCRARGPRWRAAGDVHRGVARDVLPRRAHRAAYRSADRADRAALQEAADRTAHHTRHRTKDVAEEPAARILVGVVGRDDISRGPVRHDLSSRESPRSI